MAKDKQPEQPGTEKTGPDPRRDGAPDRAGGERDRERAANPDEIAEADLDKVAGGAGTTSLPLGRGG